MPELAIQVVEIAEGAGEEKVLSDVAEGALDLALRFRAIGSTRARLEAVVPGQIKQGSVVDHQTLGILPGDGRLHAVIKDLAGNPADRSERRGMAAQDRLQVLVQDEPGPDQARVAQYQGEQPNNAFDPWLVGELNLEAGQVDLGLLAGWGLEPNLDREGRGGPDHRDGPLDGRIGSREAALLHLPPQPDGRQPRVGAEAFAKIRDKGVRGPRAGWARSIGRGLKATGNVFGDCFAIEAELAGDGRDLQALPVQFQ